MHRGAIAAFVLLPILLFTIILLDIREGGNLSTLSVNATIANDTGASPFEPAMITIADPLFFGTDAVPPSTIFVDVDNYDASVAGISSASPEPAANETSANSLGADGTKDGTALANESEMFRLVPGERVDGNPEFVNVDNYIDSTAKAENLTSSINEGFLDVDRYIGTSLIYEESAQPNDGPDFVRLHSKSKKHSVKVSKSIYENLKANQTEKIIVKLSKKDQKDTAFIDIPHSDFAALTADYGTLVALINSGVEAIYPDMQMSIALLDSIQLIGAEDVHNNLGHIGSNISICLLDTGVDTSAAGNVVGGYDFVNDDLYPDDDNGHGTRMAKVINAIAPDAKIIPVKVLDSSGTGYSSVIMQGITYCIQRASEYNIRVISMSFGGGQFTGYCSDDPVVSVADNAYNTGISVVASSGNDGAHYITAPACGKNVTTVSATTKDDEVAPFSNINGMVDLLAPGQGIIIGGNLHSGTSLSAAMASASFALLYSYNQSITPQDVELAFKTSGVLVEHGGNTYARIDAYNALMGVYTGAPTNQTINETQGQDYNYTYSAQEYNSAYNAIIAYRSNTGTNTLSSPKIRFWNSTGNGAWGSEIELPTAGSPVRWAIAKWSPISAKIVVVTLSDDGYLDGYVCMGNCTNVSNWQVTNNIGQVWAVAAAQRRFDVEFETRTGDAIVVYGILSTNTNRDLAYRVLPASYRNFTGIAEEYIDDTGHATDIQYTWVRLDRNPINTSEELIVVGFDSTNTDVNAWVWNGAAWGNQVSLDDTVTRTTGYEAIAVRYAADGSEGMAITGGLNTIRGGVATRYWSGGTWSAITTFDVDAGDTNDVRFSNLKADPTSDDLQAVFIDSGADLHTAYWNGATWAVTSNIDDAVDTAIARCADVKWLPSGSIGYLVWDTDGAGTTVSYRTCSPQCTSATQTASAYAGTGAWMTLYRNTVSTDTVQSLNARLNVNNDIGSFTINSTAPTFNNYGDAAITADTTVTTFEAYSISFKVDRIPPTITFVSPTPANGSNIWPRNWAFINVTITDNVNVSFAVLEWNGTTNYTMNKGPGDSWYYNVTGLGEGAYTYRVFAADFAENMNVSVVHTVLSRQPPSLVILEPLGGNYSDNRPVPLVANVTDPNDYNVTSVWAHITYPNSTTENVTLYTCRGGDNFDNNTVGIGWFVENTLVGPNQVCVADINSTVPGKAFTSLMGSGAPFTDTLCTLVSNRAIYGDFDLNISFEVLSEGGDDYAINFQVMEVPTSADAVYYAFISLSNWSGLGRNYEVFVDDGNISGYISRRPTDDTFGKFRIRRAGDFLYFYTWNNSNSSWHLENSSYVNYINILHLAIESESTSPGWGYINASWDNLSISNVPTVYFNHFNTHVHPIGNYNVSFYAVNAMGALNDSEKSNFTIVDYNDHPSKPFLLTPFQNALVYGLYNITWSQVSEYDNDSVRFNITLLNPDGNDNATIISDYGNISTIHYEWNTSAYPNGNYSIRIVVYENETADGLSNSYTIPGVFILDKEAPSVIIISPHGEDYPQFRPLSISTNITDPDGIDYAVAEVEYPNGTKVNVTLGKGQQSDDFSADSLGINWTDEQMIGPAQECIININSTAPGMAFTGIYGNGLPESDTLCSLISKKAIDGDFDIEVSFNITYVSSTDNALNFQITNIPSSAQASRMIFISLSNWTGFGKNYEVFADDGNFSDYLSTRETNDTYGKMRITRAGNNFTFYTWNNSDSSWIEESSATLNFGRAVYVTMEAESAYPGWGAINVTWDNFTVRDENNTFGILTDTSQLGNHNVTIIARDTYGRENSTERTNFTIVYQNRRPSKPYLLTPWPDEIVTGSYQITWSNVVDRNNDTLRFNITLLNPDYSFNSTIVSDYGNASTVSYEWDSTTVPDGVYSIEITVYENETSDGLSNSYMMMGNFTVHQNCPVITSPGEYVQAMNYIGAPNNASPLDPDPVNYTCVKIASSDVVYDCNDFSITDNGTSAFGSSAILLNGSLTNVTVKNCPSISNYSFGVIIYESNGSVITNVTSDCKSAGFVLGQSFNNVIINTTAHNGDIGYILILFSANNTLSGNTALNSSLAGIAQSDYAGNNTIYSNLINNSGLYGIFLTGSANNNITQNVIYNSTHGVFIVNSSYNNITNNQVTYNSVEGIYLDADSSSNAFALNRLCFNDNMDINNSGTNNTGTLNYCDYFSSWFENNLPGCTYTCSLVWHRFFGNLSGNKFLAPNNTAIFYQWQWDRQNGGKIYAINGDASIQWADLVALGKDTSGGNSTDDFAELDTLLNMTGERDSITALYAPDGSNPLRTENISIYYNMVNYIPVANSSLQTDYKTGIVWDASQGGSQFNITINQDVVFLNVINGTASPNYDIRIPSNFDTYKGSSGVVEFWVELE